MSETADPPGGQAGPIGSQGTLVERVDLSDRRASELDFGAVLNWAVRHWVLLAALVMIAVQLAWKANFLSNMYFRQDDFYNIDLALQSPLNWHYLSFNTAGNIVIGTQLITWVLARTALFDWGMASAVVLLLLAAADLAALRLLRTLFGERPAILIPLAMYLLAPVTLPGLGWWSAALESVPLQLAIFTSLNAHVRYLRTGQYRHVAAAVAWMCFGLAFFEKALVLPVLLFLVTAAFFGSEPSFLRGARQVLVRYWRAWLIYAAVDLAGAVLVAISLRTSTIHPQAPASVGAVLRYAGALARDSLIPGMFGGPWQWLPLPDGSYALAAPPTALAWLAVIGLAVVIGASLVRRKAAWRPWAIMAVWVIAADIVPVAIGRLNYLPAVTFGMETRYIADAVPVIAVCFGLAFWPVAERRQQAEASRRSFEQAAADPAWRAAAALAGVFVFGSLWSAQTYANDTTGRPAARYIANAERAVKLVPRGSIVMDWPVPSSVESGLFGKYGQASTLIGDMERGKLAGKLRWLRSHPSGTIDRLLIFGDDGRLYPAMMFGIKSVPRTAAQGCWPVKHGRVVVKFASRTSIWAWELRVGYIWASRTPGLVTVQYGKALHQLQVRHGLHSAYLPISGSATSVVISGFSGTPICVGDAEAGSLGPDPFGPIIPPTSS